MWIIFRSLILISFVMAVDFRKKHGRRRDERHGEYDQDDNEERMGKSHVGYKVHKTCHRSGMVALTFDDGVV